MGLDRRRRQQDRPHAAARSAGEGGRAVHAGAGHDVDLHGQPGVAPDRPIHVAARDHGVRPGAHAGGVCEHLSRRCCAAAGYWTGYVGKYDVGAPRSSGLRFSPRLSRRPLDRRADGERIHVTEKNARDSIDFLRARPKDKPFALSVGFFAAARRGQREGTVPAAGVERGAFTKA